MLDVEPVLHGALVHLRAVSAHVPQHGDHVHGELAVLLDELLGRGVPVALVRGERVVVQHDVGLLRGLHVHERGVPLVDVREHRRGVLAERRLLLGELLWRHLPLVVVRGERVVVLRDVELLRGVHVHERRVSIELVQHRELQRRVVLQRVLLLGDVVPDVPRHRRGVLVVAAVLLRPHLQQRYVPLTQAGRNRHEVAI